DLRIAMIRQNVNLVFPLAWINQKVKSTIGILHLRKEISLPFGFLEEIAFLVAAFRNPKIVQVGSAGKNIRSEYQMMNERRAVDGVLAVVSGIVMATAHIDRPGVLKRIKRGGNVFQRW